MVLMLVTRVKSGGVIGAVAVVQTLFLRELLPTEQVEELLVLELHLRSLWKAFTLETGGLELEIDGVLACCDSGAA